MHLLSLYADSLSYSFIIVPNILETLEIRKVRWNNNSEFLSICIINVGLSHIYTLKTSLSL